MDLLNCIEGRRSVRVFQDKIISEEKVKYLLGKSIYAPSGKKIAAMENATSK